MTGTATPFTVLPGCTACGACLPTCPERCIRPAAAGHEAPLVVLAEACTGCGECAEVCPAEAIRPVTELAAGGVGRASSQVVVHDRSAAGPGRAAS